MGRASSAADSPGWRRLGTSCTSARAKRARWTNGRIERFFEALKSGRLYRHDIGDGVDLAGGAQPFRVIYNSIPPHEALGIARQLERYHQTPTVNLPDLEPVSSS